MMEDDLEWTDNISFSALAIDNPDVVLLYGGIFLSTLLTDCPSLTKEYNHGTT
jgi:hypothetical protein